MTAIERLTSIVFGEIGRPEIRMALFEASLDTTIDDSTRRGLAILATLEIDAAVMRRSAWATLHGLRQRPTHPDHVAHVAYRGQERTPVLTLGGVEVMVVPSCGTDGAVVVMIDTPGMPEIPDGGPDFLRIALNDCDLYVGCTYEHAESQED